MKSLSALAAIVMLSVGVSAHAQTEDEVGDADSFNRPVTYLGLASLPTVTARRDCQGAANCVTLPADNSRATVTLNNLDSVRIPGRTTNSLVCGEFPAQLNLQFWNTGSAASSAFSRFDIVVTVANKVLEDPSLIDPTTGLPFNGRYSFVQIMNEDDPLVGVGELVRRTQVFSRGCRGGLVSRNNLKTAYGLSNAQIDEFFRNPITLTFGVKVDLVGVFRADFLVGARLYGDRR
jgi:hypothetical protein